MNIDDYNLITEVPVIVTAKNGLPAVELRKITTNPEVIKIIIQAAYHNKPIIILPAFKNRLKSISSLIEKGIIYKGIDSEFYFNDY